MGNKIIDYSKRLIVLLTSFFMLKATRPIKIPVRVDRIKKSSKKDRENHLRRFKFHIPHDELRLRERCNELELLGYEFLEKGKYTSKDFMRKEEVILFLEYGMKVLEIGGEVLNQFHFANGKVGLDLIVKQEYFNSSSLIVPMRFCCYKNITRVYKKKR